MGEHFPMNFPEDSFLSEVIDAIKFRLDLFGYLFIKSGVTLKENDYRKISDIFLNDGETILCYQTKKDIPFIIKGKLIKGMDKDGRTIKIGTLNSTSLLFSPNFLGYKTKKLKTIFIGDIIIKPEDNTCLFSLGIKEDFNYITEYEE